MFRRVGVRPEKIVSFQFEGQSLTAPAGDSVAAALLSNGVASFRHTPERNLPRGPFCMMGVCFDCLVEIDGRSNQQACQVEVADGMKVSRAGIADTRSSESDGGAS